MIVEEAREFHTCYWTVQNPVCLYCNSLSKDDAQRSSADHRILHSEDLQLKAELMLWVLKPSADIGYQTYMLKKVKGSSFMVWICLLCISAKQKLQA